MAESESDDEDVSFIEEIKSPQSTSSSSRDRRTPRQARPDQARPDQASSSVRHRLSFPGFADPVAVPRRPLAAKKEAQEAEETRINNILIEAGIDPAEYPDSTTRKNLADALSESCDAEGERRRRQEQEEAFKREAGLMEDDDADMDDAVVVDKGDANGNAGRDRGKGLLGEVPEKKEKKGKNGSAESAGVDKSNIDVVVEGPRRLKEKAVVVAKVAKDRGEGKAPGATASGAGEEKRKRPAFVYNSTSEEEEEDRPVSRKSRRIESDDDDEEESVPSEGKPGTSASTTTTTTKTTTSPPTTLGFDDIVSQYSTGFIQSGAGGPVGQPKKTFQFYKSKNARQREGARGDVDGKENNATDAIERVGETSAERVKTSSKGDVVAGTSNASKSFLDKAVEKADRSAARDKVHMAASSSSSDVASSSGGPPRTPVSLSATRPLFDGSFVKDTFSGFQIASSSSSQNASNAAGSSSQNGKISVKDIKELLQDEERMARYRQFREEFMAAKHRAVKKPPNDDESETMSIKCSENVVLIPGTLFVDTEATSQAATRRLQGGVQPMRSCRIAKLAETAVATRTIQDPDNSDDGDFLPSMLKSRVVRSSSRQGRESSQNGGTQSTITIDDEQEQELPKLVPCPICDKSFSSKAIENHVEKCLNSQNDDASGAGDNESVGARPRRRVVMDDQDFLTR